MTRDRHRRNEYSKENEGKNVINEDEVELQIK
jgi:hypothetical protein